MNYHPSNEAESRALMLLTKHLTAAQRHELAGYGQFTYQGRYQWTIDLNARYSGFLHAEVRLDGELVCVRTRPLARTGMPAPRADQALAYLLVLRHHEDAIAHTVDAMRVWPRDDS